MRLLAKVRRDLLSEAQAPQHPQRRICMMEEIGRLDTYVEACHQMEQCEARLSTETDQRHRAVLAANFSSHNRVVWEEEARDSGAVASARELLWECLVPPASGVGRDKMTVMALLAPDLEGKMQAWDKGKGTEREVEGMRQDREKGKERVVGSGALEQEEARDTVGPASGSPAGRRDRKKQRKQEWRRRKGRATTAEDTQRRTLNRLITMTDTRSHLSDSWILAEPAGRPPLEAELGELDRHMEILLENLDGPLSPPAQTGMCDAGHPLQQAPLPHGEDHPCSVCGRWSVLPGAMIFSCAACASGDGIGFDMCSRC